MNDIRFSSFSGMIKDELLQSAKLRGQRAYIRDMFVRSGSLANPQNSYHLEFVVAERADADRLLATLTGYKLKAKKNVYRGSYKVYIKDSESIAEFLRLVGAHKSLFELENTRILKGIKNDVNRRVNFEACNLDRVVQASVSQINDIELISSTVGLDSLPAALAETARLRLDNPDDSLEDLARMLSITKSGVNHRLRKLNRIAAAIKNSGTSR